MNGRPLDLEELGSADLRARLEAGADTVLVPIGSIERHGNAFTPLGLDGIIVREVVERAARKADVVHAPLMPFGWAPMHMGAAGDGAGAVTLRSETFRQVLNDVGRSLIYSGFDKIVFCTLHGPNVDVCEDVLYALRYETGALVAMYGGRESSAVKRIFDSPAARLTSDLECSMAMALVGTFESEKYLARSYDVAAPEFLGTSFSKTSGMGSTLTFDGASNVHVGLDDSEYTRRAVERPPPSMANAERGAQLLDSLSDHLAAFAREVKAVEVRVHRRDWPERAY
jgi:creatinine amidohydrolase/Fe(II)-dependent formamide hydrolase-like protein